MPSQRMQNYGTMGGMLKVELHIPRPMLTLGILTGAMGWMLWLSGTGAEPALQSQVAPVAPVTHVEQKIASSDAKEPSFVPVVAPETSRDQLQQSIDPAQFGAMPPVEPTKEEDPVMIRRRAEERAILLRARQVTLVNREKIFELQLKSLADEQKSLGENAKPEQLVQLGEAVRAVANLKHEQRLADRFLSESLGEMWEAEQRANALVSNENEEGTIPIYFVCPLDSCAVVTAPFGDEDYKKIMGREHTGMDFRAAAGSAVYAAADGTVAAVVDNGKGFNYILIKHVNGLVSLYGHLSPRFLVQVGQQVLAGDQIGWSDGRPGMPGAGISTGPHLHFEMRMLDPETNRAIPVDPLQYLPPVVTPS